MISSTIEELRKRINARASLRELEEDYMELIEDLSEEIEDLSEEIGELAAEIEELEEELVAEQDAREVDNPFPTSISWMLKPYN